MTARRRQTIPGDGRIIKSIAGMGTIYDWRHSSWTPVNGGQITVQAFVHHIPVVRNADGIADFVTLRNVLVSQGLMVQTATDNVGNVALYTPFNYLCYHAKGANSVTAGCEHMHLSTSEPWTKRQMRASAWVIQLCDDKHNVTTQKMASIGSGSGTIRVLSRGQTEHEIVSAKAGYHDRSDPGPGYDHDYVAHCVRFFDQHQHFSGA
jgi:hypothetical protein